MAAEFAPTPADSALIWKAADRAIVRALGHSRAASRLRRRRVRRVRMINLHSAAFIPADNLVFVPSDMTNAYREWCGEFSLPHEAHRVNAREWKPPFLLQLVERDKTHVTPRSLWCPNSYLRIMRMENGYFKNQGQREMRKLASHCAAAARAVVVALNT